MLVEVKISYDPSKETIEQALASLSVKTPSNGESVKSSDPKSDPKTGSKADEPKAGEKRGSELEPSEKSGDEPVSVSKTDVRAVATALSKAGKKAELKTIFESFGGQKLSDIKESDYPALMQKLREAADA